MGGLQALSAMEAVETDNKDRPIEDITINSATVFVDPFKEADNQVFLGFLRIIIFLFTQIIFLK